MSRLVVTSSNMFGGTQPQPKTDGISALGVSPNGRLVAYGLANGTVLVYDLKESPPMLIRYFSDYFHEVV